MRIVRVVRGWNLNGSEVTNDEFVGMTSGQRFIFETQLQRLSEVVECLVDRLGLTGDPPQGTLQRTKDPRV
jgi:hypothetical protein